MSDHRFGLKIWFSIYGKEFEWAPDLNWNNHTGGVDDRIIDWFTDCYAEARAEFETDIDRREKRRAADALEASERAELNRLKAKYEGDAAASTEDFDRTVELGPDWHTDTDNQVISWGRMNLPDIEHGVRWHDPTPAGDFTVTNITCRVCGHKVALKRGDVVKRGDPRLCEHLGGPGWTGGFGMKAEESSPGEIATISDGQGYWPKGDLGDDPDGDLG